MRRNKLNRLDSTTSMKAAVGVGCLRLLFSVVGVGFSLAKVGYGSEYIEACPSMDIIPVYIVLSGCLPVLLTSLKQECDYKAKCESRVRITTAILAIAANLAWLILGTLWTLELLKASRYGENLCNGITLNIDTPINKSLHSNDTKTIIKDFRSSNLTNVDDSRTKKQGSDIAVLDRNDAIEVNITKTVINSATEMETLLEKEITVLSNNCSGKLEKQLKSNGHVVVSDGSNCGVGQDCVKCEKHVMVFSLACNVIDWIMFVIGSLYLCSYCCHRVIALKDQLLVNNV